MLSILSQTLKEVRHMKIRISAALIILLLALLASGAMAAYTPGYCNEQCNSYSSVPENTYQSMTCARDDQCPPVTTCNKGCSQAKSCQKACPQVKHAIKLSTSVPKEDLPARHRPVEAFLLQHKCILFISVTPTYPFIQSTSVNPYILL
jgi:hypothetical protein